MVRFGRGSAAGGTVLMPGIVAGGVMVCMPPLWMIAKALSSHSFSVGALIFGIELHPLLIFLLVNMVTLH